MAGFLATIGKAAGKMAAGKAKDVAATKAKNFITGKKKGKGGSIVKNKVNKEIMGNMMGRKIGGDKGGVDIPASKQTINVSAQTVGGDVGSGGGGSAIVKQVQDISVTVSAIAESMKSGLILKDKQEAKRRKAAEKAKRAAQESDIEKPDEPKKEGGGIGKVKVPGVGILSGIFGFLTKFIFGVGIMKLIELADSPLVKGIFAAVKGAGKVIKFLDNFFGVSKGAGALLNALISFIDFGYKISDGAEKLVKNIFGEEGAEKFRTFMENLKTLINSFLIFKIIKGKIGEALAKNIKNAFKLIKNSARRMIVGLKRFIGPGARKGIKGLFQAGKGLAGKGASKVGGFAAKIFGKAAKFVAPALKAATPAVKGFASRIPIMGPIIIALVSLMSGEPAGQALFKAGGAALGGALGTFIPIPFLGTLIGETIGVFVGDLLYELILGGGVEAAGQKLKDTFMTIFKGGQAVANWLGGGIKAFINNVLTTDPIKVPEGGGVRSLLTRGTKKLGLYGFLEGLGFAGGKDGQVDKFFNPLNLINPLKFYPLLFKSFFGKKDEGETTSTSSSITGTISANQETFDGKGGSTYETKAEKDANAVATETTYESGEGDAVIIPVPVQKTKTVSTGNQRRRGGGVRTRTVVLDDSELAMYGGK